MNIWIWNEKKNIYVANSCRTYLKIWFSPRAAHHEFREKTHLKSCGIAMIIGRPVWLTRAHINGQKTYILFLDNF